GAHRPGVRLVVSHRRIVATHRRSAGRRHRIPPSPPPDRWRVLRSSFPSAAEATEDVARPPFVLGQDLLPHLSVPDAELVDIARDRHVALDTRVLAEQWREQDPALDVEPELLRRCDVEVAEGHDVLVEGVHGADPVLDDSPPRQRIYVEAVGLADPELGGHEALLLEPGERLAELDRDGHPTLVIDRMLEVAPEHPTGCRESLVHTGPHLTPLNPTAAPEYPSGIVLVKQDFRSLRGRPRVPPAARVRPAGGGL